jgi:hypothetical protein
MRFVWRGNRCSPKRFIGSFLDAGRITGGDGETTMLPEAAGLESLFIFHSYTIGPNIWSWGGDGEIGVISF